MPTTFVFDPFESLGTMALSVNVIYSGCSQSFWVEVASRLQKELDWHPCYWIADASLEPEVANAFPEAIFHKTLEAVRAIPAMACAAMPQATLDKRLLEAFASTEVTILKMMDRMDMGGSFLYEERARLYRRLLAYWIAVLERFNPGAVVFSTTPHMGYDYLLYRLCRHQGVKTVFFELTKIPGLVVPYMSVEDDEESVLQAYYRRLVASGAGTVSVVLSSSLEQYWRMVSGGYDGVDANIHHRFKFSFETNSDHQPIAGLLHGALVAPRYAARVASLARRWATVMKERLGFTKLEAPRNYLKLPGVDPERSFVTGRQYWAFRRRAERRQRSLRRLYDSSVKPVDNSKPYIYVALNYQPERTTSPLGGVFVDQFLMVDLLSKTVPEGWQLYVKEHPTQFYPPRAFRAITTRSESFYRDLVALPNVQLVPMAEKSPFDLIDHAKAVAVVSGTAAWEAVVRGKPALVFGRPWYVGCEGIFYTPTRESCARALDAIEHGYAVDREKVKLFLCAVEQVGFRAYVDPVYEKSAGVTYEQNVEALTNALKQFWWKVQPIAAAQ